MKTRILRDQLPPVTHPRCHRCGKSTAGDTIKTALYGLNPVCQGCLRKFSAAAGRCGLRIRFASTFYVELDGLAPMSFTPGK